MNNITAKIGKRLDVDLSTGKLEAAALDPDVIRQWIGGRALNAAMLYKKIQPPTHPLGPQNDLLITVGLLTGTAAPSASRVHVSAVSPLTGMLGSSNMGGYVGAWLKALGYQGIRIRGQSRTPVFLEIGRQGPCLHDARRLWGLDTWETHRALVKLLGTEKIQSVVIGPAGENGALFACIVTDQDHVAGRTGMGAVMGAKGLKAIVVHKPIRDGRTTLSDDSRRAIAGYTADIMASPDYETFSRLGGAGFVQWADRKGLLATRNYRRTHFEQAGNLDSRQLEPVRTRSRGCARCPVQCKAVLHFSRGRLKDRTAFRPEFEPMLNLGAKCGLTDLESVVYLDNLCTRLGLDSTSAATAIAFVMDLAQRGLFDTARAEGLELSWGNADAMEHLIRQMAAMKGLGATLGRGIRQAARHFGPQAQKYAAQVKGLELTAYHPAALLGSALGYAISSRGGDYNNVYASLEHRWTAEQAAEAFGTARALDPQSYEGKGRVVCRAALVNIMLDSLGLCKVPALSLIGTFDLENEACLATALTGWDLDADGLFQRAAMAANAERLVNHRLGAAAADDTLPDMFFEGRGLTLDRRKFKNMVAEFYAAMGWDKDGLPVAADIRRLDAACAALD